MNKIIGYYNRLGYRIESNGEEIYSAGNSIHDSQCYVDIDSGFAIPLDQLRSFCIQTAKEFAEEREEEYVGVEEEEEREDED